jgi:hypothetical protein
MATQTTRCRWKPLAAPVAGLNELGIAYEYIEMPGSGHGDVVAPMAMMNLIPPGCSKSAPTWPILFRR